MVRKPGQMPGLLALRGMRGQSVGCGDLGWLTLSILSNHAKACRHPPLCHPDRAGGICW